MAVVCDRCGEVAPGIAPQPGIDYFPMWEPDGETYSPFRYFRLTDMEENVCSECISPMVYSYLAGLRRKQGFKHPWVNT